MIISEKMKLTKKMVVLWLLVMAVFAAVMASTGMKFGKYMEAQDYAVSIIQETNSDFSYQTPGPELVEEMYNTYTRYYSYGGINVGYAYSDADKSIGDMLEEAGYPCYKASEYLKYTDYFEYTINENTGGVMGYAFAVMFFLAVLIYTIWYVKDSKKTMVVQDAYIIAKKGNTVVKQFQIKDIKSIEAAKRKGLKILGNGFKYKINLVKNRDEIRTVILEKLQSVRSATPAPAVEEASSLDEIKKVKDLLDTGIITQEEFDAKKKQLLGL